MKKGIQILLVLLSQSLYAELPPKLFLNCPQGCFEDYIRQELNYFDFVRDRYLCDFQFLVNNQESGNGGKKFSIRIFQVNALLDSITFVIKAADTDGMVREQLLHRFKLLLIRHNKTNDWSEKIEISIPKRSADSLSSIKDPWNYWVFAPEVNGYVEGETNLALRKISGVINVRRITNKHKFTLNTEFSNRFTSYTLDSGYAPKGSVNEVKFTPLYAFSLNKKWSLGFISRFQHDAFRNIAYHLSAAPLIEYNIFPINMNASKQLRLVYQFGAWHNQYQYETIFNKTNELLPYQRISVITDFNQAWGSVQVGLHFNSFLNNLSKNRLSLNGKCTLRIFEGLALTTDFQISIINDQISLVKTKFSDEVYLLYLHQLPTFFNYFSEFGLVYTFGSIHNTIVNPRFGQVE